MSNKALVNNTIMLYLTTVVKLVGPLITLPYLTRVLSVEAYGFVAYVKTYASYVMLLLDFGFILSATKTIASLSTHSDSVSNSQIGAVVGNTIVEKSILCILGAVATQAIMMFVPLLATDVLFTWVYYLSCVASIFILDFLYRGIQRMEFTAYPLVISKITVIIFTVLLVNDDSRVILIPLLELIGNAVAGACSCICAHHLGIRITITNASDWICDLKDSSIYFLSNVATSVFTAFTTMLAGFKFSISDVAAWSLCMNIVSAAKAMYTPISNSLFPYMIQHKDINIIRKLTIYGIVGAVLLLITVSSLSADIITLIAGEKYVSAGGLLSMMIPTMALSYFSTLYGWPFLGVFGKSKEVTLSTILAALIQLLVIAAIVVSNSLTLFTLALSCATGEAALLLLRLYFLSRYIQLTHWKKR